MHISIEGIDGVGKSSTAKLLADKINFKLIEKPLHYLFDEEGENNYIRIRDRVNSSLCKEYTAWFYGLGNIFLYEKFKSENIITDRHIASNYGWSGAEHTDYIFDAIYKTIGAPTFTFLLYASEEEITKRIKHRDPNDSDLKKTKHSTEVYMKMKKILEKYNIPYLLIDSSAMSTEEVVNKIYTELKIMGFISE